MGVFAICKRVGELVTESVSQCFYSTPYSTCKCITANNNDEDNDNDNNNNNDKIK